MTGYWMSIGGLRPIHEDPNEPLVWPLRFFNYFRVLTGEPTKTNEHDFCGSNFEEQFLGLDIPFYGIFI